jgi:hypothetical protein
MRLKAIAEHGGYVNVQDYGARLDGSTNDAAAHGAAADAAQSGAGHVQMPAGVSVIASGLTYKAPLIGAERVMTTDSVGGSVSKGAVLLNSGGIAGGSAMINIDGNNYTEWRIKSVSVDGAQAACIGVKATNNAARYHIENVTAYECGTSGFDLDGVIGSIDNCYARYCATGMVLSNANATTINGGEIQGYTSIGLDVEGTTESLHIAGLTIENTGTGTTGVRIAEGCDSIALQNMYFEGNASGYHISAAWGGTGATSDAVGSITLDNLLLNDVQTPRATCRFGNIISLDLGNEIYNGPVQLGATCRSVTNTIIGEAEDTNQGQCFSSYQQIVDATRRMGRPVRNLVVNPNFYGSAANTLRGYQEATYSSGVTSAVETSASIARDGRSCLKVTTASGNTEQYAQLNCQLLNQAYIASIFAATNTGEKRRIAMTGWIRCKSSAVYSVGGTYDPQIGLRWRNDGAEQLAIVTTGTTLANSPGVDRWQRFVVWADITLDGSTFDQFGWMLFTRPQNATALGATADLYLADLCISIDGQSIEDMLSGRYEAASPCGHMEGDCMVFSQSAIPTDAQISFAVGDRHINAAPAAAGYLGSVCTTAGTGATATWKQFGLIEA